MLVVAAIVISILVLGTMGLAIQASRRKSKPSPVPTGPRIGRVTLQQLRVGASVEMDRRRWIAVGVLKTDEWQLWHLADGQLRAAMFLSKPTGEPSPDDKGLFAVHAEDAENLDPNTPLLGWRKLTWKRVSGKTLDARAEGERQLIGATRVALEPKGEVEIITFSHPELSQRFLQFLRYPQADEWQVWIGSQFVARDVEVSAPISGDGAPEPAAVEPAGS